MPYGLNPLYVTTTDLNPFLVDKTTGAALAGGSIVFYEDVSRTTQKLVYQLTQLTAVPPNYSYTALPNPLTLSGTGTIVDSNGNQVALYYYPYDNMGSMQLYFIEVYDANGLLQFTYEAWPYPNLGGGGGGGSGTVNSATQNSIAYYASTGTAVSGIPTANSSVFATSSLGIPNWTQALPSQVQVSVQSLNSGSGASSSTFWRGDGTWASTAGGTAGSVTDNISQFAHGFTAGQAVYLSGGTYTLAIATSIAAAEVVGIVSSVTDANNFVLTTSGLITGLAGFTAGTVYWLSDSTPGLLTATEPLTVGHIQKPLFVATTTTAGYLINYRGEVVPSPTASIGSFLIGTASASASSSITFNGLSSSYSSYQLVCTNVIMSTTSHLYLNADADATGQYSYAYYYVNSNNASGIGAYGEAANFIEIAASLSDSASSAFTITIYNPGQTDFCTFNWQGTYANSGGHYYAVTGGGNYGVSTTVSSIALAPSTGTITSGLFYLYGYIA